MKQALANKILKMNNLFFEQKSIFWWGAGSSSVIFLNQIDKDILRKIDLTIVDGDSNKWHNCFPGLNMEVQPFTILKERQVDLLVIASELYGEILATIRKNNILAKKIEVLV